MRGRLAVNVVGAFVGFGMFQLLLALALCLPDHVARGPAFLYECLCLGSLVGTVAEFTLWHRIARGEVEAAPEYRF